MAERELVGRHVEYHRGNLGGTVVRGIVKSVDHSSCPALARLQVLGDSHHNKPSRWRGYRFDVAKLVVVDERKPLPEKVAPPISG